MARIAILDRGDMNAEQARVYDAAKQSSGIVGGPYYAYIRLPKLFEACQNLRASLSSGPLSQREQQIVNLIVARHWNARYPWFAQVRRSLAIGIEQAVIDAINPHGNPSLADAREHRLTERKVEQLSPEPGRKDRLVRGIGWRPPSVDGGHLKLTVDQEVGGSSPPSCTRRVADDGSAFKALRPTPMLDRPEGHWACRQDGSTERWPPALFQ
jgi:hypothetical protein